MAKPRPFTVAIVGGSGSGKSWLADRLQKSLGNRAVWLSLDEFYKDRSHLPPVRRELVNFDNPQAIDWPLFLKVLRVLKAGRRAWCPRYDFAIHSRHKEGRWIQPKPIVLVDGLWLLHSSMVRGLFDLTIFLECCAATRLKRRLARDLKMRGRTRASVLRQFRTTVQPMHRRFVESQKKWAEIVLPERVAAPDLKVIIRTIRSRTAGVRLDPE